MNNSSSFPGPQCICRMDKRDPFCPLHGVFVRRSSGEFQLGEAPKTASEAERQERARRRRNKHLR